MTVQLNCQRSFFALKKNLQPSKSTTFFLHRSANWQLQRCFRTNLRPSKAHQVLWPVASISGYETIRRFKINVLITALFTTLSVTSPSWGTWNQKWAAHIYGAHQRGQSVSGHGCVVTWLPVPRFKWEAFWFAEEILSIIFCPKTVCSFCLTQ